MITDDEVIDLFKEAMQELSKHRGKNLPFVNQFFRGVKPHMKNQHPGGCARHMVVFEKHKIIPEICFGCYKVFIEPKTVVELLKLMILFEKLDMPSNNRRKCSVEGRSDVGGAYKGYVFCDGLEDARRVLNIVSESVSNEISDAIDVKLKHGCSEFTIVYPEFAAIEGENVMRYKPEWGDIEHTADEEIGGFNKHSMISESNATDYSIYDYLAMNIWLRYAATIGDQSYLSITGSPVQPIPGLQRPGNF